MCCRAASHADVKSSNSGTPTRSTMRSSWFITKAYSESTWWYASGKYGSPLNMLENCWFTFKTFFTATIAYLAWMYALKLQNEICLSFLQNISDDHDSTLMVILPKRGKAGYIFVTWCLSYFLHILCCDMETTKPKMKEIHWYLIIKNRKQLFAAVQPAAWVHSLGRVYVCWAAQQEHIRRTTCQQLLCSAGHPSVFLEHGSTVLPLHASRHGHCQGQRPAPDQSRKSV